MSGQATVDTFTPPLYPLQPIQGLSGDEVAARRAAGKGAAHPALVLRSGDQIVADGPVIGEGRIEVDESLLTGESDAVTK